MAPSTTQEWFTPTLHHEPLRGYVTLYTAETSRQTHRGYQSTHTSGYFSGHWTWGSFAVARSTSGAALRLCASSAHTNNRVCGCVGRPTRRICRVLKLRLRLGDRGSLACNIPLGFDGGGRSLVPYERRRQTFGDILILYSGSPRPFSPWVVRLPQSWGRR